MIVAAQKALALLEAVARLGSGATARDIAQLTGIPPSTAYRLLNVLVADGYLVRIADLSGFALGRRTRELAGIAAERPDERRAAVDGVRAQVRFGVVVASFADDRVRLVDHDPDHELPREDPAHLHASAIGKLLLAQRPELVPEPRALTARTIVEPQSIARELRRVRDSGVAREVDELRVGRSAVAVPIRQGCTVVGCVAAIGRTGRLRVDDARLVAMLRDCAERIAVHDRSQPYGSALTRALPCDAERS